MNKQLLLMLGLLAIGFHASLSAQTINATQTDELIIDNGASGKADPNDRIRYKVTIQNTAGAAGTNTQLNIVPDPRTTFLAGTFRSSPLAVADAYACTGNVGLTVAAGVGLKANDFDDNLPGATITAGTFATTGGGSIVLAADGSFTYTPAAGFTGSDTYTYTLNDGNAVAGVPATDMAVVTFTVSDMIWFVDNTGGGSGGTGTLANPFKTLGNFNGSAGPQAGHVVFVKHTGTAYAGGIVLKNNMYLFGSGHSGGSNLADAGVLPFTVAANSSALPAINGTKTILYNFSGASIGIALASGNTIRGIEVGRCNGAKISGNGFGTLTIGNTTSPDVVLNGNNKALDLTNGTFAASSKFASISCLDTSSIILNTVSGTLACGSTAVNGVISSKAIDIQNSSASLDFGSTTVNHLGGGTCISITNSGSGSVTFSNLSMPNAGNGIGLIANAGGTINIGGTASAITARLALDITNTSFGTGATFASITSTNSGAKGVNLDNVTGSVVINGGSITNANGIAFDLNAGSSTVTYAGTISNANRAVEVTGRTGGTVTFSGNITNTGTGINVASNTGGTIIFSGASKSLNTGGNTAVTLATNTGATVNFTGGGLVLTTTSGKGFDATGGGTVTVQGTGNTISSTTGTALNVTNTTIGASNLNFQTISANGAAKGIVLNSTGSGGLNVTGTVSTDGSGGTIQNITTRGAEFINAQGISLKNMNFTNACTVDFPAAPTGLSLGNNTADNASMHFQDVSSVTLDNLNITTSAEQGINGHTVTDFTLTNSVLSGLGGGPDEDGLHFYNLLGTCSISGTNITSSGDDNVNIQNVSGTSNISISDGNFNTGVMGSGLLFGPRMSSNTTINISGVTCNNNFSGGIVADASDGASMEINVSTSTITNNNDAIQVSGANGNVKFDIHDNGNISLQDFVNITILKAAFSTGGTLEGRIRNNTIITENGHTADGISVFNAGAGTLKIAITNNSLDYAGTQRSILLQAGQDGNAALEATVTGNNIDIKLDGTGNAAAGILAQAAVASPSGDPSSLCADIGGAGALKNIFTHSLGGSMAAGDIRVRQRFISNVRLPGYGGGGTDTVAAAAYLDGRNTVVSPSTVTINTSISGGGACAQPSN